MYDHVPSPSSSPLIHGYAVIRRTKYPDSSRFDRSKHDFFY